jgi:hypothetical protein
MFFEWGAVYTIDREKLLGSGIFCEIFLIFQPLVTLFRGFHAAWCYYSAYSSMKGVFVRFRAIAIFLTVFCLAVFAVPVTAEDVVQVTPDSVNFGQVKQGELALAKFQLLNTGTQAVTIQFMEFSDPGLIAQVNPHIGIGSPVEVLVNWKTGNLSGDVEGQVVLSFADPQYPAIVLPLNGTVIPAIEVSENGSEPFLD